METAGTDQDNAPHDASYAAAPHDRSAFTYTSSYTDFGHRQQAASRNPSYGDPASQSYVSVPVVKIVDVEPGVQMFPSKPKVAMGLSVLFTFICCFACSIPAIIFSKQAMDYEREGERRLAARLANQIAFWLVLSLVGGVLCWSGIVVLVWGYRYVTVYSIEIQSSGDN